MNRLDYQTAYGLATLALLAICGLGLAVDKLASASVRAWRERRVRIAAARLNDCKPGCFMMNKGEDVQ